MRRFLTAVVVIVASVLIVFAVPVAAVSPSEEACQGTFDRERGEVSCVVVEEGKNPRFTEETETTGQGNIEKQGTEDDRV